MEIRDQRNCNWYWVDKAVYLNCAKNIGLTAFAVYNALCVYSNGGKCWPSMQTVADKLGVSRRSISTALDTLEKASLIKIESGATTGNPNVYILLNVVEGMKTEIQGCENTDTGVCNPSSRGVGSQSTTNNNTTTSFKNTITAFRKKSKTTSEVPPAFNFDLAYSAYPRKLGRAKAEEHFKSQVKTQKDMDDLLLAIENYSADIKARDTEEQYIKHAATFFNKNWRDWIDRKPVAKTEVQRYTAL